MQNANISEKPANKTIVWYNINFNYFRVRGKGGVEIRLDWDKMLIVSDISYLLYIQIFDYFPKKLEEETISQTYNFKVQRKTY